ncbi:MAG: hypothetical protein GY758_02270 [Fuerstiella sp.]|nr:hypothetical protein [Fuerstiella sp.]
MFSVLRIAASNLNAEIMDSLSKLSSDGKASRQKDRVTITVREDVMWKNHLVRLYDILQKLQAVVCFDEAEFDVAIHWDDYNSEVLTELRIDSNELQRLAHSNINIVFSLYGDPPLPQR